MTVGDTKKIMMIDVPHDRLVHFVKLFSKTLKHPEAVLELGVH